MSEGYVLLPVPAYQQALETRIRELGQELEDLPPVYEKAKKAVDEYAPEHREKVRELYLLCLENWRHLPFVKKLRVKKPKFDKGAVIIADRQQLPSLSPDILQNLSERPWEPGFCILYCRNLLEEEMWEIKGKIYLAKYYVQELRLLKNDADSLHSNGTKQVKVELATILEIDFLAYPPRYT